MLSYKFTYKWLVINDFEEIKKFLKWERKRVLSIEEIDWIHTAEVRHSETPLMWRHWIYDSYSFLWKRVITLAWTLVGKTEKDVLEAIKYVKTVFSLPAVYTQDEDWYDWLYIDNDELDFHYKIKVKVYKLPDFQKTFKVKNKRKFIIQVKAADPRFYSQKEYIKYVKRTWYQPGVRLSNKLPIVLTTVSTRRVNCFNWWTVAVPPYIELYWPLINPVMYNIDYWVKMKLNTIINEWEKVIIDVKNHRIVKDDWTNLINTLSVDSWWLRLYPGDNRIDLLDDGANPLEIGVVPTWYWIFKYNYAVV